MVPDDMSPILQAAAIPYRLRDRTAEFCLITSFRRGHWGVPKGIIDPGETPQQTALKEAEEEAGLFGRIEGGPLGTFEYFKWGTVLYVTVYLMRVTQVEADWQEARFRKRAWYGAHEARATIHRDEIRAMITPAMNRIQASR
jgi:phosphohistidine phosphatase